MMSVDSRKEGTDGKRDGDHVLCWYLGGLITNIIALLYKCHISSGQVNVQVLNINGGHTSIDHLILIPSSCGSRGAIIGPEYWQVYAIDRLEMLRSVQAQRHT